MACSELMCQKGDIVRHYSIRISTYFTEVYPHSLPSKEDNHQITYFQATSLDWIQHK